jgi:hypothetical protein
LHDLFEQLFYCPKTQSLHVDLEQAEVDVGNPIPILGLDQAIERNQACLYHASAKHHGQLEAMKESRSCGGFKKDVY